jgi:hypothetical protein
MTQGWSGRKAAGDGPGPLAPPAVGGVPFWRLAWEAALVFGLSCGVFGLNMRLILLPPAWRTFEFCQYAEIGRNLAVDGTFDTRLIEPMALALLDRDWNGEHASRWPVVDRYPLPCLVVAGLMRLREANDATAAWSNGLAISLLAASSYVLARSWYGPGWGVLVGLLFLSNPSFYGEFVLLGTPDIWFASLLVLELVVWSQLDLDRATSPRPALPWAFALGLLGGLAYLARFNVSLFLAVQAAVLLWRRRWREAGVMVLTTASVATPLFLYNWHHFHRPVVALYSSWNLLDGIGAYQVEPWLYYQVPDVPHLLLAHPGGLARKFVTNLFTVVAVKIWSLWRCELLIPLALIAPWVLGGSPGATGRFIGWSIGLFALQLVVFSALRLELLDRRSPHHGRYFFWFAAPMVVLGVGTLRRWSSRARWLRGLSILLVLAQLGLFGMGWRELLASHAPPTNLGRDPIRRMLMQVVTDGQVIASNQPQLTAWFCGLRSISLPANPTELDRVNRSSPTPVHYLFIDTNTNWINLDVRWAQLTSRDPRTASPWEAKLLRNYAYVLPPKLTRPMRYVLLRRRDVHPSPLEQRFNPPAPPVIGSKGS